MFNPVMCVLYFGVLTRHDLANRRGELFLSHGIAIFLDRRILPTLTLCQNGVIIDPNQPLEANKVVQLGRTAPGPAEETS